jgi:hypothetical protein
MEVMGHEDDACTGTGNLPEGITEGMERMEIKTVGWFVKDEGLGIVDKGSPDKKAS